MIIRYVDVLSKVIGRWFINTFDLAKFKYSFSLMGPIAIRVLMLHWSKAKYVGKFTRHISPQPMNLHLLWVPGDLLIIVENTAR
jgi:hypothetical protein